ncbi:hypothetical protein M885DRAFT_626185 [Pelagophyceae sp. CCMP2097]|nr:hypothetical protein M885DRAFT_626185 [Pelagophyceae sp. CCMP2097]
MPLKRPAPGAAAPPRGRSVRQKAPAAAAAAAAAGSLAAGSLATGGAATAMGGAAATGGVAATTATAGAGAATSGGATATTATAAAKAMNYQRLYDGFVSLSASTGIDIRKPTHFGRVNAVQTLNNSGLDGDLAQRAPQTQAMGSAEVLAVIDILVPRLLAKAKAIQAAFDLAAHGQRKDTKELRLHTLLGSSKAAVFQVKAALNSDVVARLFLGNPVFKLRAFISPEFDALIAVVRSFEEAHLTNPCAQFGPLLATVGEAVQMSVQPLYGQLVQTHNLVERFAFGAPTGAGLALGRPEHVSARPLPPLALQPAVREVTPGFRHMTRDMLSLYGLRPGLRNALKTKMSKIRLIVGMVEEEVESPAHQGLTGALQAVDALIPPSTAKFSKKRNWEGLLKVIRLKRRRAI